MSERRGPFVFVWCPIVPKKTATKENVPAERPKKGLYRPEFCEQAAKLCRLGAIDTELAEFFGVGERTIRTWKTEHEEFAKALSESKAIADAKVVRSLFERATGYSHPDTHISVHQGEVIITPITKHYPPDTTAAIFWLKNRDPEHWRDRQEITGKDGGAIQTTDLSMLELARRIAFVLTSATRQPPKMIEGGE